MSQKTTMHTNTEIIKQLANTNYVYIMLIFGLRSIREKALR